MSYNIDTSLISDATLQNWERLSNFNSSKLLSRANKKLSKKQILPIEYVNNQENLTEIMKILDITDKNNFSIADVIYSLQ